jgi:hypothetical protein
MNEDDENTAIPTEEMAGDMTLIAADTTDKMAAAAAKEDVIESSKDTGGDVFIDDQVEKGENSIAPLADTKRMTESAVDTTETKETMISEETEEENRGGGGDAEGMTDVADQVEKKRFVSVRKYFGRKEDIMIVDALTAGNIGERERKGQPAVPYCFAGLMLR